MSNNTFLDIDDSIITKNLMLQENMQEHEIDQMIKQLNCEPYITIQPTPGICLKSKTNGGQKVFINICVSPKIPAPQGLAEKLSELSTLSEDDLPTCTIPMSIGNERLEADKGGTPCATYDVVINSSFFEQCKANKTIMAFTTSVILDAVSNKSSKDLSEHFVILKNRTVFGKLQEHRIQNREAQKSPQPQKPLIEEISSNKSLKYNDTASSMNNKVQQLFHTMSTPYVILKEPSEDPVKRLIGLFQMPKMVSKKNLTVLLDPDRIVITVDGSDVGYDVYVSYTINVDVTIGYLDKDLRVLRLNMPVV